MSAPLSTIGQVIGQPDSVGRVAPRRKRVPLIYGIKRVSANPSILTVHNGQLVGLFVWAVGAVDGKGQIDSILGETLDGRLPPENVTIRHYLGTPEQGVDADIAAAVPGYADTLRADWRGKEVCLAYSVLLIPDEEGARIPSLEVAIRGRHVFDPRTEVWGWSDNPSLICADFIGNATYGQGRPVYGVETAADANDELIGGQHRRTLNISISTESPKTKWAETLRNYAGVFLANEGEGVRLIPDRPRDPVGVVYPSDIVPKTLKVSGGSVYDAPTAATVWYTDTRAYPWQLAPAYAELEAARAGLVDWNEVETTMDGKHNGAEAQREADEIIRKGQTSNFFASWTGLDEAGLYQAGDVLDCTGHPLIGRMVRLLSAPQPVSPGRYRLECGGYDLEAYSEIQTYSEIGIVPPAPVSQAPGNPTIGGILSGVGAFIQGGDGTVYNRVRVDLSPGSGSNFAGYEIRFREQGSNQPWQPGTVSANVAWLFPVEDLVTYEAEVKAKGKNGIDSDWVPFSETVQGKDTPPATPTSFDISVNSAGIRRGVIGYGTRARDMVGFRVWYQLNGAWVDLFQGTIPGQVFETSEMPAGNVQIRVCAEDRTGNRSAYLYETSNIDQDADGLWYDVNERIAQEQARNNNQDNSTIPAAQAAGDSAQGSANNLQWNVIPPISSTANTANNTGNDLKFNVIPPISSLAGTANSTANGAKSTGDDLKFNVIPPISSTANAANSAAAGAQSTANTANSTANSANNTGNDLKFNVIPPIDTKAGNAQSSANNAQGTANAANSTANQGLNLSSWLNNTEVPRVEGVADNAQGTANGAQNAANNAQGTADAARAEASTALAEAIKKVGSNMLLPGAVTYDKMNILELGSVSANLGLITAGIIQGAGGARNINFNSGDFINGGNKFRVDSGGNVYADELYIYGTYYASSENAVTGYYKVSSLLQTVSYNLTYDGGA